jgi:serine/threonine protein kinase
MDNPDDKIIVRNVALSDTASPIALPDGKERIPLGSGVITALLGQGGMAAVYEIWNSQLEMFRAVKLINPGSTEAVRQRFQTEIKISAKLSHPNIVEIHGVGEWNGLPFIEMEKISGIGLDALIAERGALPPVVCTAIGIMICRALNYAHNQDCSIYGKNYHGVIHRDLKPANIMICASGIVKLMDFGIARPADVSFHTMDGLVAGTLQYLAPEQLEKKSLDVTTDIYALGVTMYEIVTGIVAFPQTSFPKLVADKSKNRFKPLEEFHIKLPPRLRRLIYKCMEQSQDRRVPTAAALLDELHKIHALLTNRSPEQIMAAFTASGTGKKTVLATRHRFPWRLCATVCGAAALAAAAYLYAWPILSRILYPKAASVAAPVVAPAVQPPAPSAPAPTESPKPAPQPGPIANADRAKRPASAKPSAAAAPEKSAAREPSKPEALLATLSEKYGTNDELVMMERELAAKNYQNVLGLYDVLPAELARTPKALMLKMRVLVNTGSLGRLAQFLGSNSINDGEFVLEKAKFAFRNRNYAECRRLLAQCLGLPHAFVDYDVLKQDACYYTALCASAEFDANPTDQTYKEALDAWWQLKNALRSDPDHEYNKKAASELQRMAKKMQKE